MALLQPHFIKLTALTALALLLGACNTTGSGSANKGADSTEIVAMGGSPKAPSPRQEDEFKAGLDAFKSGNRKKAEGIFLAMTKAYPGLAAPHANLGMVFSQKGDYKQAIEAFKKSIELNDQNAEVYNLLAIAYRETGQFDQALESYHAGLKIDPEHPNLVFNIGILYDLYLDKPETALKYFHKYREIAPHDKQVELWITDINQRTIAKH